MDGTAAPRLVAVNVGVKSPEELDAAKQFWETLFGVSLADWGQGGQQARVGSGDSFFYFNIRIRNSDEPQYGHSAAFGLSVDDVDDFHRRALAAGAKEHFAPTGDGMPRSARFEDPVGNRVVIWQG